jgi:nitric oxide reductase activation protein
MTGYTILRVFRDYGEQRANEKIFDYVSNGCNRDGLAVRAAHELMNESPFEHKVLILLSDVKPHDAMRIPSEDGEYAAYEKDAGVRDTAAEVRRARADGIAVICVFTGEESELPAAKLVYGKDFAWIPSVDMLADAVGNLLQDQIRNL